MEKIPFTPQGLETIKAELAHLKGHERQAVINAIAEAREHGDLSENAEYHAARERQSFIEGRITELEDVTSRAEVIDAAKLSGEKVTFGTSVEVADEDTDVRRLVVLGRVWRPCSSPPRGGLRKTQPRPILKTQRGRSIASF